MQCSEVVTALNRDSGSSYSVHFLGDRPQPEDLCVCYHMALTAALLGEQYSHFMTEKQTQRGQVICTGPHSSCLLGTRQLPGKSSVCQCCRWGKLSGIVFPTPSLHLSPRPFLCPCTGCCGQIADLPWGLAAAVLQVWAAPAPGPARAGGVQWADRVIDWPRRGKNVTGREVAQPASPLLTSCVSHMALGKLHHFSVP